MTVYYCMEMYVNVNALEKINFPQNYAKKSSFNVIYEL